MSVVRFNEEEILKIEGQLLYHLEFRTRFGEIENSIKHSNIYNAKYVYEDKIKVKVDEKKLLKEVIGRLFWYLWIANKTAYALQYKKEPDFFGDVSDKEAKLTPCTLKELRGNLKDLRYHISTNDGHYFLSEEWSDLFNDIIEAGGNAILNEI